MFVRVLLSLFLIVLACGSGWWLARSLPVRFHGEKVLIGLLIGGFTALAVYGIERIFVSPARPSLLMMFLGWFFLQGLAGEVTVQLAARHRGIKTQSDRS